ncbi:ferulic acid esterase (FaeA) [Apiospora sp. TS-2023a]
MRIFYNVYNLLTLATVAAVSGSGCSAAPPIPLGQRRNATLSSADPAIDGRTFMYWLPPSYNPDKPNPLILSFHGGNANSDRQANQDFFADADFNTDHVVVYPQGLLYDGCDVATRITVWQGIRQLPKYWDDVAFVLELLDFLEQELLCIDATRVYAAGKSMGGGMVDILACDERSSGRIAAIVPVAAAIWANVDPRLCTGSAAASVPVPACPGKRACPVPVMAFHGLNDTTVPFNGGPVTGMDCVPPVQRWVEAWAGRDGLDPSSPTLEKLPSGDNATVYRYGGDGDDEEGDERLVTLVMTGDHANHDWPTTVDYGSTSRILEPGQGPTNFNGTSMMMDFFRRYKTP